MDKVPIRLNISCGDGEDVKTPPQRLFRKEVWMARIFEKTWSEKTSTVIWIGRNLVFISVLCPFFHSSSIVGYQQSFQWERIIQISRSLSNQLHSEGYLIHNKPLHTWELPKEAKEGFDKRRWKRDWKFATKLDCWWFLKSLPIYNPHREGCSHLFCKNWRRVWDPKESWVLPWQAFFQIWGCKGKIPKHTKKELKTKLYPSKNNLMSKWRETKSKMRRKASIECWQPTKLPAMRKWKE